MGRGLTDLGDRVCFLARPEVVPENHPIPLNTVSPCELVPACRRGSRRQRPISLLLHLRNQVRS